MTPGQNFQLMWDLMMDILHKGFISKQDHTVGLSTNLPLNKAPYLGTPYKRIYFSTMASFVDHLMDLIGIRKHTESLHYAYIYYICFSFFWIHVLNKSFGSFKFNVLFFMFLFLVNIQCEGDHI